MKEIGIIKGVLIYFGVQLFFGVLFLEGVNYNFVNIMIQVTTILLILWVGKVKKEAIKNKWNNFKEVFKVKEGAYVILTHIIVSLSSSTLITTLAYKYNPQLAAEIMGQEVFTYSDIVDLVIMSVLVVVILAPIVEEFIFRRILFSKIAKKLGIIFGIIISSVIFGLLHVIGAAVGATLLGAVFCILYQKYKNILVPMVIHMVNNGIVTGMVIISFLLGEDTSTGLYTMTDTEIQWSLIIGGILLIIGLTMFGFFVWKNRKYLKKEEKKEVIELMEV